MPQRYTVLFTAPYQIEIETSEMPQPQADELLVQTAVSAISPGTEMLLYRGQMPSELATDETIEALAGALSYPLAYGYAAVGHVIDCGQAVDKSWLGRMVFAFNPHQSHFVARPQAVQPLPKGMAAETAVFLPNMETAVSFIMDAQPMIGEQVAVFGQGVVGLLTTMLLADFPLAALVTADGYALRREWSRRLGATAVFDPQASDFSAQMMAALQGERPFAGADLALELSGNPQALDQAIGVTGQNGRVVIGSWYGQKRADLNLGGAFHRSQMQLISSQVSRIAPRWNGRWSKPRRFGLAWQMLARHQPQRLITQRVALADAGVAYALLAERADTAVQILFTYT